MKQLSWPVCTAARTKHLTVNHLISGSPASRPGWRVLSLCLFTFHRGRRPAWHDVGLLPALCGMLLNQLILQMPM